MMIERRYDGGRLQKSERTPQGGARVPAALTRVGVLQYLNPDGSTRREYRPANEVFQPESLASLQSAPVTAGQHTWVTPENWRELSCGHVVEGSARQDGDMLVSDLVVQDGDTLRRVDAGELQEISCGYTVDFDPTPGVTPDGQPYDGVQRNIKYNHVTLLGAGQGRAGREAALRLDSTAAASDGNAVNVSASYARMVEANRNAWRGAPAPVSAAPSTAVRQDAGPVNVDSAYARMVERNRDAWRKPSALAPVAPAPPPPAPGARQDAGQDAGQDAAPVVSADASRSRMIEANRGAWQGRG